MLAVAPQVFLLIGDNIYADTEDIDLMRRKYAQLGAVEGFQRLRSRCRLLATWDDHDYGVNDGGAEYPQRDASERAFLDFFNDPPESPRRQRPGVYAAYRFGPPDRVVQIILLDTRYFRGPLRRGERGYVPNDDPRSTMLGEPQWQWLAEQLRQPAQLRIVASSIQVVPEDHPYEKWMNLPLERERLFRLIRECDARGVVFVSGDRHLAELSVMDGGVGYPLYDLTSSGLNCAARGWRPQEINRHRVATMNWGDNFGLVTIDWQGDEPLVGLEIRDVDGRVTIRQRLPLNLLSPGVLPLP